jgi:hypothetical protein
MERNFPRRIVEDPGTMVHAKQSKQIFFHVEMGNK